ncbi:MULTISPECIES: DUF6879 family protein [Streptacidiphilus]|uniref:DUF6879 family protein n=1 Tax=Streptacidiphilus cavernicola TaxID=3342716 RepID=A0ABV6ULU7_9ACTN|nr:DUF6879 family protein [Streptacidiphilus jeojiense]
MASSRNLFEEFEREAFRLETLDNYNIPRGSDDLRAFLAGEEQPESYRQSSWVTTVREATTSGKRMYRVHVLARPLTDYLRFELDWGYHRNAAAGEEFFILDTTDQPNPLMGVPDFWLFDDAIVNVMHYDETAAFTGSEILADDRTAEFIAYRDTALAQAEPFVDWWAKHGT